MEKIENWLDSRIGLNFRTGLGRMEQAIRLLGHPEKAYPTIHVTGTNGKGSTVAFLQNLLDQHQKKVGTFTSPHMETVHDRICLNGQPISESDFSRLGEQVRKMEQNVLLPQDQLSYFEILSLIAFLYFAEQEVDVALIEVGIGGLLDTTNVITGSVSVITSIGLDHQETLGTTLEEIAEQKAGIFKVGSPAVIGPLPEVARQVCRERAKELNIDLYEYGQDFSLENKELRAHDFSWLEVELGLSGTYQEENAAVAVEAFLLFMERQSWNLDLSLVKKALAQTSWAGRLEKVCDGICLDGAHNLPAVERLVEFIKKEKDKEILILFGALKRKDYSEMLHYLQEELPQASLFLTSFSYGETIGEQEAGQLPFIRDYRDFLKDYLQDDNPHRFLFVTGSLYFIAEVRQFLKGEIN
ncbi:bifunctional folylpolyglutamate synthase/dihydrofolate synthase [Streptococcus gordonii]|uniref:bifunctional folylpolyglutamate synthase/dihydrofolate synthase n=1 Tax=Streptococcus gordonii TaxID=1302 RepID=UPI001C8BBDAA|nr:folylpolyglutamate synthase/dihydrofolate synthase family protein [Streptococcus gordonii]MBX9096095.1 bifunctional folylpolyglutamate synthase/dihydrofolate synthase [Streptococcus gordonii]